MLQPTLEQLQAAESNRPESRATAFVQQMRITAPTTPEMMLSADVLLMKGDVIYDNRLLANFRTDCVSAHSKFSVELLLQKRPFRASQGFTSL